MTNGKGPGIALEPNITSLADGTSILQPGRPPGVSGCPRRTPCIGNPGKSLGQRPLAVVIDGVVRIGNFHLIEAIEGTWLSAATRKFGWDAEYGAKQGYGAYKKGIVRREDGSCIWGLPEADRIKPGQRFYIKIFEGKDEEVIPEAAERVSQIVYYSMRNLGLADGIGKHDIWSIASDTLGKVIDSGSHAIADRSVASALNGETIGDEVKGKRQIVEAAGNTLEKVDIGLYVEFEDGWVTKFWRSTGWFKFYWGTSDNKSVTANFTKIRATKGDKEAYLYNTTETLVRDKFLREKVNALKLKVLHVDKNRKPRKITLNEAQMICPKRY